MPTLFISDLHLQDSGANGAGWLNALLRGPARHADALYVLGDLFEFWIGDDAVAPVAAAMARETSQLVAAGVPCYFLHGNRDFLLGQDYAELAGLQLLAEEVVVDLYGQRTLLLHGDTLCTDDVEYQAFRRQSRDPAWQAAFLGRSVEERLQMARAARDASMQHTGAAAVEIMDVNEASVIDTFQRHSVTRMIHGHTHRPAVHHHDLGDGSVAERFVLADWYKAASYLEVTAEGVRAIDL